jgi:transcriptional regulator with PAS, ATPase and Fis domain
MTSATQALTLLIGGSAAIQNLRTLIPKVAARECNVLITGETGTGKERVAEAIHACSPRAKGNLVYINCAAVPDSLLESELFGCEKGAFTGAVARREGYLQQANGGTVFLDEIGDMSPFGQAKILRAIEQKQIYRIGGRASEHLNVRVVAATNQNLANLVTAKQFRNDLYYRLNVVNIHLPPLRERPQDIEPLFQHFVHRLVGSNESAPQLSTEALARLAQYEWPGNVRELKNLVELSLVHPEKRLIDLQDLPTPMRMPNTVTTLSEREQLMATLCATQWNKTEAAKRLQCSRMTLYRKMLKYDLVRTAPASALTSK